MGQLFDLKLTTSNYYIYIYTVYTRAFLLFAFGVAFCFRRFVLHVLVDKNSQA